MTAVAMADEDAQSVGNGSVTAEFMHFEEPEELQEVEEEEPAAPAENAPKKRASSSSKRPEKVTKEGDKHHVNWEAPGKFPQLCDSRVQRDSFSEEHRHGTQARQGWQAGKATG